MKTTQVTPAEMETRIARFARLKPLPVQSDPGIPLAARDVVYARKLLSVIGLDRGTDSPINNDAPIKGAGGMTITLAVCPPGQGPDLHSHRNTFETFTALTGRWEVFWNDDGSARTLLEPFDTISVPPGVSRGFRNVGAEEAILQVIITGGVHDLNDIAFRPAAAQKIRNVDAGALEAFEKVGFKFDAGGAG